MTRELDDAVILESRRSRESDRLLTLYTRRFGKVRAFIRNIRSSRRKHGAPAETGQSVEVGLWFPRDRSAACRVTDIAIREPLPPTRASVTGLMSLHYALSLLDEGLPFHDPHPGLFDLLLDTIRELHAGETERIRQALRTFEVRLLDILGIAPSPDLCGVCGSPLEATAFLSPSAELACISCAVKGASRLDSIFLSFYRDLIAEKGIGREIGREADRQAKTFFRAVFQSYLGRPLRVLTVRRAMR
jgi:DNA repair protein RecO (recombination protein O)